MLNRCAVFAGGFDLPGAIEVAGAGDIDEYQMLDLLDSLVRKSLLTVGREHGHTRYTMLETIRQFAEDQLAAAGESAPVRDRHARHFADAAALDYERYWSPHQSQTVDWFETRTGEPAGRLPMGVDHGDLDAAATIAGMLGWIGAFSLIFEPVGWCVELLESPDIGRHRLLKWLYMGAPM